ncbi:DUF4085 family protein [Paenibacillus kandeliae]|uniref:DUF4085 family protein n=1 Tax=Paenibacillus kandeliae TaxID=3231269 RepID=UPI003458EB09
MKYWTKEIYEEMQAYSLPGFYETEAELEEARQWAIEDGYDFVEQAIESNTYRLPLWEKYLSPELVAYARNHQMLSCYLPEENVVRAVEQARREWEHTWHTLCQQYVQHYEHLQHQLPAGVIELQEQCHIHDAKIISVKELQFGQDIHNAEHAKTIEIRMVHGSQYGYRFTFTGVTQYTYDVDIHHNVSLYKEVDIEGEEQFAFRMLLCNAVGTKDSMNEMGIVFHDVTVEQGSHLGAAADFAESEQYDFTFEN